MVHTIVKPWLLVAGVLLLRQLKRQREPMSMCMAAVAGRTTDLQLGHWDCKSHGVGWRVQRICF